MILVIIWYLIVVQQLYFFFVFVKFDKWVDLMIVLQDVGKDQFFDGGKIVVVVKVKLVLYGSGFVFGFSYNGDFLVSFVLGVVIDKVVIFVVFSDKMKGMFSNFGIQVQKVLINFGMFIGIIFQFVDEFFKVMDMSGCLLIVVGLDCWVLYCVVVIYDDGFSVMILEFFNIIKKFKLLIIFFEMGNSIMVFLNMVQKVVVVGMEIGNYIVIYLNFLVKILDCICCELEYNLQFIKQFIGVILLLFCLFYGVYNDIVDKVVKDNGMVIIQWQIDSEDWKNCNFEMMYKNVMIVLLYIVFIVFEYDIQKVLIDVVLQIYKDFEVKGKIIVSVSELFFNIGGYQVGYVYCNGMVKL